MRIILLLALASCTTPSTPPPAPDAGPLPLSWHDASPKDQVLVDRLSAFLLKQPQEDAQKGPIAYVCSDNGETCCNFTVGGSWCCCTFLFGGGCRCNILTP